MRDNIIPKEGHHIILCSAKYDYKLLTLLCWNVPIYKIRTKRHYFSKWSQFSWNECYLLLLHVGGKVLSDSIISTRLLVFFSLVSTKMKENLKIPLNRAITSEHTVKVTFMDAIFLEWTFLGKNSNILNSPASSAAWTIKDFYLL